MYEQQLPKFVREPDPEIFLYGSFLVLDFETTNKERGTSLDGANGLLFAHWRRHLSQDGRWAIRDNSVWADEYGQHELLWQTLEVLTSLWLITPNSSLDGSGAPA